MTRARGRFEPDAFAELEKYWTAVDAAANSLFTLHGTDPSLEGDSGAWHRSEN